MTARATRIGAVTIRVDDDQPTFWAKVEAGGWEPGTLAILDDLVEAGVLFLDIGAWVGPLTLFAAARGAEVLAVEADPAALDQLDRNLAANPALASRVTVVRRAVHAEPGRVRLGVRRKAGDSMSSLLIAGATSFEVETVTPCDLAAMVRDGLRLVVKIDIEGAEYDLMPHMTPLLGRPGTAAIVSFHPRILAVERPGADLAELTRQAMAPFRGWRAFAVGPQGAEPRPERAAAGADLDAAAWLFVRP